MMPEPLVDTPLVESVRGCRACGAPFDPILDLGSLVLSDFLDPEAPDPPAVPLDLVGCQRCGLVQLRHAVARDRLYRQYWYRSGVNETMRAELADVATAARAILGGFRYNDLFVDVGANDGTLLNAVATVANGPVPCRIAFEPAENLYELLHAHATVVYNDYFPGASSLHLIDKSVACLTQIACFYGLDDPLACVAEVDRLLTDDGLWIVQMQDLAQMIQATAFDNICAEHRAYYSTASFTALLTFAGANLRIVGVERRAINGGSLRYYLRRRHQPDLTDHARWHPASVQIATEMDAISPRSLDRFAWRVSEIKSQLLAALFRVACHDQPIDLYGACYDSETRAVTTDGLKRYDELRVGDRVITINPTTQEVEIQAIEEVFQYEYAGELIHFHGKRADLLVTPNHRMLRNSRGPIGTLKFEFAATLERRPTFLLPLGIGTGVERDFIDIRAWVDQAAYPGRCHRVPDVWATADLLYLLGLYVGDGYAVNGSRRGYSVNFCIPVGDKARYPLEELLTRLGITYRAYQSEVQVAARALVDIFSSCGSSALEKRIPRWALDFAPQYLEHLLRGLIDSDGWRNGAKGRVAYRTSSPKLVADVLELAAKLARQCTVAVTEPQTYRIKDHTAMSAASYTIKIGMTQAKCYRSQRVPYKGIVWCVSVPNTNLLVERHGKVTFCGNSTKASTLLQVCGLGGGKLRSAVERSPEKWGKVTSGTRIPILSEADWRVDPAPASLLTIWQFRDAVLARESEYLSRGGGFIVPLPRVEVVYG